MDILNPKDPIDLSPNAPKRQTSKELELYKKWEDANNELEIAQLKIQMLENENQELRTFEKQFARFTIEIENIVRNIPNKNDEIWKSVSTLPSKKDIYLAVGLPILLTGAAIVFVMIGDRLDFWHPHPYLNPAPPVSTQGQTLPGLPSSDASGGYTGNRTRSHTPEDTAPKRDGKSPGFPASK
jgi:hypothetical protein